MLSPVIDLCVSALQSRGRCYLLKYCTFIYLFQLRLAPTTISKLMTRDGAHNDNTGYCVHRMDAVLDDFLVAVLIPSSHTTENSHPPENETSNSLPPPTSSTDATNMERGKNTCRREHTHTREGILRSPHPFLIHLLSSASCDTRFGAVFFNAPLL